MGMTKFMYREAFRLLAGRELGRGIHRTVYACRIDPTLVVKVEEAVGSFANVQERGNWEYFKDAPEARWLAPVIDISPCGGMLLQRKVEPVRSEEMPDKVPAFLTDLKLSNFGRLDGRIVACDYSSIIVSASRRLKKADWW